MASSTSNAGIKSPIGDALHRFPPIVALLRICLEPNRLSRFTIASERQAPALKNDKSRESVVHAPTDKMPSCTSIRLRVATSDISMILSYLRSLLVTSIHASVPPDRIKRLPGSEVFNSSRNADSESTLIYPSMLSDLANNRLSSRLI